MVPSWRRSFPNSRSAILSSLQGEPGSQDGGEAGRNLTKGRNNTPSLLPILAHCLAPSRTLSKLCPLQQLSRELSFSTRGRLGLGQDSEGDSGVRTLDWSDRSSTSFSHFGQLLLAMTSFCFLFVCFLRIRGRVGVCQGKWIIGWMWLGKYYGRSSFQLLKCGCSV